MGVRGMGWAGMNGGRDRKEMPGVEWEEEGGVENRARQ